MFATSTDNTNHHHQRWQSRPASLPPLPSSFSSSSSLFFFLCIFFDLSFSLSFLCHIISTATKRFSPLITMSHPPPAGRVTLFFLTLPFLSPVSFFACETSFATFIAHAKSIYVNHLRCVSASLSAYQTDCNRSCIAQASYRIKVNDIDAGRSRVQRRKELLPRNF